jgi:hypothetical protein
MSNGKHLLQKDQDETILDLFNQSEAEANEDLIRIWSLVTLKYLYK